MNLEKIVKEFNKKTVLVIGDIMLDNYIFGEISRISPEAPIPILKYNNKISHPGGAANVALNLKSLGAKTALIGTIGKDSEGQSVIKRLNESKVDTKNILMDDSRPTTLKTRIVSSNQQLLRIDREESKQINSKTENKISTLIKKALNKHKPDAVIISDYGKGLLTKKLISITISICNKNKIFIGVDPKQKDFSVYKGTNLITPNQNEAETFTNIKIRDESSALKVINKISGSTKAGCVLITKGKKGIAYKVKGGKINFVDAMAKDVFDVTGAGDTFISSFVLSYLSTKSFNESAKIANNAAAIAVTKFGAAKITPSELISVDNSINKKILSLDKLSQTITEHKEDRKKIVFTNGCFDLFHYGHLSILHKSKKLGDILVVAINSDSSVKKLKGNSRPVINEKNRSALISSLEFVDYVIIFTENTPLKLIKKIKPDIITKGEDYNKSNVIGKKFIENYGGKVELIPIEKGFSTTKILERIKEKN